MKKTYLLATCLAIIFSAPVAADDITVVHAGRLMAIPGEPIVTNQTIIIRDGKITRIVPGYISTEEIDAADNDSVKLYDLTNMFVMPGFIDGHVHITHELGPKHKLEVVERSDADVAMHGARHAKTTLLAGFTTVRDLGARGDDAVFALRDAINRGDIPGARIFAAGDTISPTGGHGQRVGYREDIFHLIERTGVCDGIAECRRAVRHQIRRSADQIKLVSTGGVLSDTATGTGQQFFNDELKAIIDTAHSLGRKVTAHAHGTDGINAALRAGVDAIEHGTFADEESYRLFLETGAYLVPTIMAGEAVGIVARDPNSYFAPAVREKALQVAPQMMGNVRRAHERGVKIAFGTDSYVSKHGENAREFELLVEAGLSPVEAIRAATVNSADNLGQSALLGTVEVGKYGDLVAVHGDPTKDIRELITVDFVMKEGIAYKQPSFTGHD